ncbi:MULTISPECIES: 2-oxoglutarate dehydrogenase, E2 component, dihydrolipoamide succinyltransferase [Paenarthrobacter]|uniref:Dihydrolipoamide acetyltransferase component of pyruvate dehydrogenase complex n=1 Tax=Paenarthrobacter ureafaciens TaxID=37931 RepID=A0AAX3EMU5_PAEUR|nr:MULTISPECIES: 2-oxoglutarate dehydrogenase, E2 component, dihydrolipoamide succinyltransferase [Paenarthrobacter]NKR12886.1 dihydrolipoamide acetyltransferase [Arthrobacter sp. M5]NKR15346.1 dihydrolipoamide acetyltransferase [Arthrobacter sp. M6]OEH59571.1 dihydrolipoamide acetyltransferase [Arthrobacter sp. D2]OEH60660.1 dihydrolipoamide acetyltransferase [Arthrobacter sp. D4]MDO5864269.1 2-oxoglutarate dehydrogenase, E2 component, dihydrolipoamide succinyltransferase [Paenarthrobacter sp
MSESVNLPALGESVTEGTVTRWLKQVGDRVEIDEPLLEVSTDKVDTEIPSPVAGVIEEILVAEDETAEVGAPLVRIGDGSGSGSTGEAPAQEAPAAEAPAEQPAQEAPAAEAPAEQPAQEAPAAEAPAEQPAQEAPAAGGEGHEVTLPALGESVTEGTVTRWLKAIGDTVEVDEPLLEVSTDKVDTEIPSPVAGTLQEIRVSEDETAEVGSVLAVIGSGAAAPAAAPAPAAETPAATEAPAAPAAEEAPAPAESPAPEAPAAPAAPAQEAAPAASAPAAAQSESGSSSESGYVTPLVRKLANQHGVDIASVSGTGVGGRIRKQDVLAAAEAKQAAAAPAPAAAPAAAPKAAAPVVASSLRGTTEKAPRIRQVIARRMRESLEVSTQLTQVHEVDMTKIAKLRLKAKNNFQAQNGVKLTFLPFIAKAVAEALKQHPKLNAAYDESKQEITYHNAEHLAIAVDTDKGLLVPVIADAGNLNLAGLASKIADVAGRTRDGKIGPDELSGGTFSITNIGSVGALFDTPIINQPQVGILGTGAIVKRAVVVADENGDDSIAIRSMMYLSLTYDHRLVDGADAGRFLQTLKARLEEGAFEADLGL